MPTTTRRFNLSPYLISKDGYSPPRPVFADGGAVDQDGTLRVHRCDCGQLVVWARSTKTGRNYLAHVRSYQSGGYYYVKAAPHTWERHDEIIARREADADRCRQQAEALSTVSQAQQVYRAARLLEDAFEAAPFEIETFRNYERAMLLNADRLAELLDFGWAS